MGSGCFSTLARESVRGFLRSRNWLAREPQCGAPALEGNRTHTGFFSAGRRDWLRYVRPYCLASSFPLRDAGRRGTPGRGAGAAGVRHGSATEAALCAGTERFRGPKRSGVATCPFHDQCSGLGHCQHDWVDSAGCRARTHGNLSGWRHATLPRDSSNGRRRSGKCGAGSVDVID